ncbi:MAG: hypothetical protein C5B58_15605 [Acidobacteria bacterium]|nr:MAG: hypothetical protein C5B58_15605 [Acidobacteriota bacterium]
MLRTCCFIVICLGATARPLRAQNPAFNQSSDDLSSILQTSAEKILRTCQSWPPKLARTANDQNKGPNNKALVDGTNIITTQLAADLKITSTTKPYRYDASFLRLLDSVGTFNPNVPNNQLLNLALHADPSQLELWGTNSWTVKHDCLSMLSLAAQGSGGLSIPFFSLNAAMQASRSPSANQTSTFFFGALQSPFNSMFISGDQSQRIFAGLKALLWRLNNPTSITNQDEYVESAQFLTIENGSTVSDSGAVLGNMKAGVPFAFGSLSGQIAGKYTTSLEVNSTSYTTYFWAPVLGHIADMGTLVGVIAKDLPQLDPDATVLRPGTVVHATTTGSVTGWPEELCVSSAWKLATKNIQFSVDGLTLTKATSTGPLPACTITATLSFPGPSSQSSADIANPQLFLVNTTNNNVSIPLSVSKAFSVAGATSVTIDPVDANWAVQSNGTQKTNLYWTASGNIDLPTGRTITSAQVKTSDFSCKNADGSRLPFSDVKFDGAATATPQLRASTDTKFKLYVLLSLSGIPSYNDDASQPNKRTCTINGTLRVTTADASGGGSSQVELPIFKTAMVYYPNELIVPAPPTNVAAASGNGQVSLSWTTSKNAISYNIYRGTASGEVLAKSGVQGTSYIDNSLTNGTTYYYEVTAVNSVGESGRSNDSSAVPHNDASALPH